MNEESFGREDKYREQVQKSISFMGQKMDYFTEAKASILLELAQRHLGDTTKLTALDIGCGVGLTDKLLCDQLGELHGVDISESAVRSASETNPKAHYSGYDGSTLPFPESCIDLVFAINVLHHVPVTSRERFVQEMSRVVKPGGATVIFEHNPLNPLTRLAVTRCEFDVGAKLVWPGQAKGLYKTAGISTIESSYIIFFPLKSALLNRVESRLGRLPLGAQYYALGKKGRDALESA
jgi:ubiquinone/menaquinone biosynthesis C-methylase UbiE